MNYISDILYWISTGLLVPVVVLLVLLFCRSLILIGGFFNQYMGIRKVEGSIRTELNNLTHENVSDLMTRLPGKDHAMVLGYMERLLEDRNSPAKMRHLIDDFEIWADKDLGLSRTLTKMGPMLGLMGTLIPMGPALVGLAAGDISSMAYNMQVAFATTVVGLFASAVGFLTQQVKQRWYTRDLSHLEFLNDFIQED